MSAVTVAEIRCTQARLAAWVERIARQDERALSALHEAVSRDVYRMALRLVGRHAAADEVVGECFWQVWNQADRYMPERGAVMAWIASIARSRALDSLRRRKTLLQHEEPLGEGRPEDPAGDDSPEECDGVPACNEVASDDMEDGTLRIRALLDGLAPAQRQMLSLAFYGGLSHQEIAQHCCMPLGTVKSHVRRGLAALKAQCIDVGLRA